VTKRTPELQEGQRKLQSGEITRDEYADLVNKFKPVLPYQTAPAPATVQDAKYALLTVKARAIKKLRSTESLPRFYSQTSVYNCA